MDRLVIDIETKNSFADVGGQQNLEKLDASFVGVYSYNDNAYHSFFENDFPALGKLLQQSGLVIGFSINRFDIPVMKKYFPHFNIHALERYDILDEIEESLGRRIGLDILAKENLGIGKTHHGLEAIEFYKTGNFEELKNYCLNDVKITKDLYDLIGRQGYLMIPQRDGSPAEKLALKHRELFMPASLF